MVLTEEEAKKKWCPISRDRSEVFIYCLGSGCMWWKWNIISIEERMDLHQYSELGTEGQPLPETGFCGRINY